MAFSPDQALSLLKRAWRNGRLAHAFLISGPSAEDMERVATGLVALVNDWSPVHTWDDLRARGATVLEPESRLRQIRIDPVRELEQHLYLTTTGSGRKIGIITEADRLTPQAANAFLKTLEEPPADTLIILTTRSPEQLLETIRSRCVRVPLFRPATHGLDLSPPQQHLLEILGRHFSDGGKAGPLRLLREFQKILDGIRSEIEDLHADELRAEREAYARTTDGGWLKDREEHYEDLSFSQYRHARDQLVDLLFTWLGEILRRKSGLPPADLPGCAAVIDQLSRTFPPRDLNLRLRALEDLRRNLATTVREPLALESAFLEAFRPVPARP